MRRIHARLAAPAVVLALLASGCAGSSSDGSTGSGSASGGTSTLTLGATADMYGWDPINQPSFQNWAAEAVWDNLAKCGATGDLEPDIAESWEVSEDNTTFTAHLRDGMTFSDGTPVDSAAVQASFEYVAASGGSTRDYADLTYATPDALTFSVTWPEPQATMDNKICAVKITPADYIEAGQFDVPVGSGPYTLDVSGTTTGSVYTFDKNEDHWNADGYPYEHLVIKVIESDTAVVSALKTGQIDAALVATTSVAETEASGLDVMRFDGLSTRLLLTDHLGESIPALGDVRVRQAMNMVFDKQLIADNLYLGEAEPTAQVFRQGTAAYLEDLEDPYPYDVDQAKKLMAEAGYADGFTLQLPTMEGQNLETLLPYVTQQLAEINITVEQVALSGANAIGDLLSGTYPVVLWQLGNLGNSALQIYIESTPEGYWDLMHQSDDYVDSRWAQIATADAATSAELQQEINQYIVDNAWFVPLVYAGNSFAYDADKVSIPTQSDQEALTPRLRDFQ
jgi:peptide/nickel transport system substrate-binding protein